MYTYHTHAHTRTHALTHTHARTHTRTHTRTHSNSLPLYICQWAGTGTAQTTCGCRRVCCRRRPARQSPPRPQRRCQRSLRPTGLTSMYTYTHISCTYLHTCPVYAHTHMLAAHARGSRPAGQPPGSSLQRDAAGAVIRGIHGVLNSKDTQGVETTCRHCAAHAANSRTRKQPRAGAHTSTHAPSLAYPTRRPRPERECLPRHSRCLR
jgi:hypothetical protein